MRLKVNKLFGERDYDIAFNENLTILIGENGAGKSTITKILDSVFCGDMLSLSQFDFESISLAIPMTENNKIIDIVDGNVFPREKFEVNILWEDICQLEYAYDARFKVILRNFLKKYDYQKDIDSIKIDFERFLKEFDDCFQKEKSNIKIVPPLKIDKDEDMKIYFEKEKYEPIGASLIKKSEYHNISQKVICMSVYDKTFGLIKTPYGSKMYLKNLYLIFLQLELIKRYDIVNEKKSEIKSVLFVCLDGKWFGANGSIPWLEYIEDEKCGSYPVSKDIDMNVFKDYCGTLFLKDNWYHVKNKLDFSYQGADKRKIMLMYEYSNNHLYELFWLKNSTLEDYVTYKDKNKYEAVLSTKEKTLELIKHLATHLDPADIEEGNKEGSVVIRGLYSESDYFPTQKEEMVWDLIKYSALKYNDLKKDFIKENYDDYIDCLKEKGPFASGVFGSKIEKMKLDEYSGEDYILEISQNRSKAFFNSKLDDETPNRNTDFSKKNFNFHFFRSDKIFAKLNQINIKDYHDSNEARTFYELTERYFKNKDFLLAYDKNGEIIVKIYDKKSNKELTEENLSSGEYKILRLIKRIAFKQKYNGILILDEPELSLSIYWQKMLIDDILKYLKKSITIVATQSTTLVKEEHLNYLVEVEYK